jgi:hypothetical protein
VRRHHNAIAARPSRKPVALNATNNMLCMRVSSCYMPSAALSIVVARVGGTTSLVLAATNDNGKVCAAATAAVIAALPAGRYTATVTGWTGCNLCVPIEVNGPCSLSDVEATHGYEDCFSCNSCDYPVVVPPVVTPPTPPGIVRPVRVLL